MGRVWIAFDRLTMVALLIAAGVVIWRVGVAGGAASSAIASAAVSAPAQTLDPPPPSESVTGVFDSALVKTAETLGDAKARVAIIEFSDYQCPFCSRFATDTFPEIKRSLIDTGEVKYLAMNFPLSQSHPQAMEAAAAVECVREQGRFWDMRAAVFANQQSLKIADLLKYASSASVDTDLVRSCMNRGDVLATINKQHSEGQRLGVSGTPTFLVAAIEGDGAYRLSTRIVGAQPVDVFRSAVANLRTQAHAH